jgi:predicted metal-dependent hydrolase
MDESTPDHDPRFAEGARRFDAGDYFAAHEVWEDLWRETPGPGSRFVKGLIQAAVALYHLERGNWRGGRRLFHSAREYMLAAGPRYCGVDVAGFWDEMARCCARGLAGDDPPPPLLHPTFRPALRAGGAPTLPEPP